MLETREIASCILDTDKGKKGRNDSMPDGCRHLAMQISRWFVKRAQQVDQVTGSLSLSMAVIDAGIALVGEEPAVIDFKTKAEELQAATSIGVLTLPVSLS